MARTPSNMLPLGTQAPNFNLLDTVSNNWVSLENLKGSTATVIMFICNHCPFVIHVHSQLIQLALDYKSKGINFVAISSNDANTYPDDGPTQMAELAKKLNFPFPYLYDETQAIAKLYQAACTPDFYVFDENLKSTYHGQIDASRPGNNQPLNGNSMRNALDLTLQKKPVPTPYLPSIGCNIKWK